MRGGHGRTPAASDRPMYKKLNVRTCIGCLKTLPIYGGIFRATAVAGNGLQQTPGDNRENESLFMANWEIKLSYRANKVLRHHVGRHQVWEKDYQRYFPGLRCDEAGWVDIHDFMKNDPCMTRQQRPISAPTATTRHPQSDTESSNSSGCNGLSTRGRREE